MSAQGLTVRRLSELLADVSPVVRVVVNDRRNLALVAPDGEYLGFVEAHTGDECLFVGNDQPGWEENRPQQGGLDQLLPPSREQRIT